MKLISIHTHYVAVYNKYSKEKNLALLSKNRQLNFDYFNTHNNILLDDICIIPL